MSARQESHDRIRAEQYERDRPKPAHELGQLRRLAEAAEAGDAGAGLAFSVAMTPANYLEALAAEEWDRRHPWYSCVHCHDGADLPKGYVCKECGESNGYEGSW